LLTNGTHRCCKNAIILPGLPQTPWLQSHQYLQANLGGNISVSTKIA
jgi:hypothetical protein